MDCDTVRCGGDDWCAAAQPSAQAFALGRPPVLVDDERVTFPRHGLGFAARPRGTGEASKRPVMKLLRSADLGVEEQNELLARAGYTDVKIFEDRANGWICVVGKKAAE